MEQSKNLGTTYVPARSQRSSAYSSNYTPCFKYLSWPCGAGKTFFAVNHCKEENKKGTNCLIIVPTINLADQYVEESEGLFTAIHSKKNDDNIVGQIHEHVRKQSELHAQATTLVITEKAFEVLKPFIDMSEWILIKDEATEPLKIQFVKCKYSKELLKSWLHFVPIQNFTSLSAVKFNDECPIKDDDKDEILEKVQEFKRRVESENLCVLVDKDWLDHKSTPALKYCVFQKPELYRGYKKVIFMAAYFEDTYLYHAYKNAGVKWEQLKEKSSRHISTRRAIIHYFSEFGTWSADRRRKSTDSKNVREIEKIIDWCNRMTEGAPYAYCINNEEVKNKFTGLENGELMPAVCHGINKWKKCTNFLSLSSYLISNGDECFYRHWNLSTVDSRGMRNTQMIYQQLMRTNLRDAKGTEPVHIFVPTFKEALELLKYLPDAEIQDCKKKIDKPGVKTGITATLKSTWSRKHQAIYGTYDPTVHVSYVPNVFAIQGVSFVYANDDAYLDGETSFETPRDVCDKGFIGKYEGGNNTYIPPQNLPTIQSEISESDAAFKIKRGAPVRTGSLVLHHISEFCDYISTSGMSSEEIAHIKKNRLPAFVTGQFSQGSRLRKDDCKGNNNYLAFDFDDTEIPLKKLLSVFKSLEVLHYTTISDDPKSSKRRYRMVVACSRSMNLDEHERVMTHYKGEFEKLEKKLSLKHGLDLSKLTPWSKFFMPHKESTKVHLKHIERRKPLNVDELLNSLPKRPTVESPNENDLDYEYPDGIEIENWQDYVIAKANSLIDQMTRGRRTLLACRVCGLIKNLDPWIKQEFYQRMQEKGVEGKKLVDIWNKFANPI